MPEARPHPGPAATEPSVWAGARALPDAEATIAATVAVVRGKWLFLAVWILGFVACTVVYAKLMRPDFVATTQILLQPRVIVNDGPEDYRHFHQLQIDSEQCETELRILRSETLLYQVFKALDLAKSPEVLNGSDGLWAYLGARIDQLERIVAPDHRSRQAFNAFVGRVRARRLSLSYVIEISYRAQSADQAVRVANAIASAYAAYRLRGAIVREQRRGVYLEDRLTKLQAQVHAAESSMRFGTIPDETLIDSGVRLLGPASLPLGSLYPKTMPLVLLMAVMSTVSGVLLVILAQAAQATPIPRPAPAPPKRARIA